MLDRLRQSGVDHAAHVAAIDAHAERDGGDDDVEPLLGERFLRTASLRRVHAGVVVRRLESLPRQPACQLLGLAPAQAVDDGGLIVVAAQHLEHLLCGIDAAARRDR